jgi:hypothetical protein
VEKGEESEPPMRCAVCQKDIEKGAAHYRIGDNRVHVECIASFWGRTPTLRPA